MDRDTLYNKQKLYIPWVIFLFTIPPHLGSGGMLLRRTLPPCTIFRQAVETMQVMRIFKNEYGNIVREIVGEKIR